MMDRTNEGVRVIRAEEQRTIRMAPGGNGRATAFDFTGEGGSRTWIGTVSMPPNASTGGHHHGRHEVALYVISGHGELCWGEGLEHSTEISAGDLAYFSPNVPHQERNLSADRTLEFLVVRSDNERIVVPLQIP